MTRVASRLDGPARFGILCTLAYVALSWAVRFDMRLGDQIASFIYPFDTFSMYAGMPGEDRSLLLLRDRDGRTHRITSFSSFDCEEPIDGDDLPCAERRGIPYLAEELIRHIQAHPGNGDLELELVARTWELRRGRAPIQLPDCVITRCKVSR